MEDSGIDSGDPKPTFKNEAKVFVTVGFVSKRNPVIPLCHKMSLCRR